MMTIKEAIFGSEKSVQDIAKVVGVSRQAVYLWMDGATPENDKLKALCECIGVSMEEIQLGNEWEKKIAFCVTKMTEAQKCKIAHLAAGMTGQDISKI